MDDPSLRVATTSGIVDGVRHAGIRRWWSIPYGRAPIGSLRFRAPQRAAPWSGVRFCHEYSFCAPQDRRYTLVGLNERQPMSEDCLSLNIATPIGVDENSLPVMVFIHGGGYLLGSSATPLYHGAALARSGCVYVSVNYRLGALGCLDLSSLSSDEHPIESNLFLRDLVLALKWIRDNIAQFGGNPNQVTIFGESAGAHAVTSLLAVPAARGLFHGAIAQSPPAGLTHSTDTAAEFADMFVAEMGMPARDAPHGLTAAQPSQLINALATLITATMGDNPGMPKIGPTVDGVYLPHDPIDAMKCGEAHRIPLIIGHNAEEGALFQRFMNYLPTNRRAIERVLALLEPEVKARIVTTYPGYPDPKVCLQLGGDLSFGSFAWSVADAHSRHAPTFLYRYDFAPRTLRWVGFGATHATELFAVFDLYRGKVGRLLSVAGDHRAALRLSDNLQRRWSAFSHGGVPGSHWPRYEEPDRATMIFDRHSRVEFDPAAKRRQLWDEIGLGR
jgi:para-nitrobenzyl esterase